MHKLKQKNRISQIMVSLAWISLLVMVSIGFERYLQKQENPNDRPAEVLTADGSTAVVKLLQNRQGHYIAEGKLNGHWASLILDTGATNISIPGDVADRMGLKEGIPERTRTANGDIIVFKTVLDSVKLGAIELVNVPAHVNPHMKGEGVLLGMSFLKHLDMNQKDGALTLRLKQIKSIDSRSRY
ncbi:MAG: aspartyl protease [Cycloclasticus sp. symbiont of Poecilosclerida sp. M]|nr:MAG: aspartyl protease [Cycloclasticus sp. symbiont of Poecilosclerida sp. M]